MHIFVLTAVNYVVILVLEDGSLSSVLNVLTAELLFTYMN